MLCPRNLSLLSTSFLAALVALALSWNAQPLTAQMVQLSTPRVGVGHSFQENIGVNFGFNIPGARPGPNGQLPNSGIVGLTPQGNVTPNGALQFRQGQPGFGGGQGGLGFGIMGGGGGGAFFGITGGQSSTSSINSSTPSVTVMNGGWGTFQDVRQQPFVTGLTPVVGDWVGGPPITYHSVLAERVERLYAEGGPPASATSVYVEPEPEPAEQMAQAIGGESTAARGDLSVAEIRRQQELEDASADAEVKGFLADARQAEAEGNLGVAIIHYRRAARHASGAQQQELLRHIDQLNASRDR